ncbi:TetR/AcrR family transcriptional regulator [Thermodesulfobacteriota bacterium]
MRITEEAKKQNRDRIVRAAARLFNDKGFEDATTRDIAQAAGLAVGTMFNYFPSKETLAMTMVNDSLILGAEDYQQRLTGEEDLVEDLFLFVVSGLNRLRPMHPYVGPVLEKSLSPFPRKNTCREGEITRLEHLAAVRQIIGAHGHVAVPEYVSVNLYWSLYLGILAFWANDETPRQEATLALIDYSLQLFVKAISTSEEGHVSIP